MKKIIACLSIYLNLLMSGCYLPNQPGPLPRGTDKIEYDTKVNVIGVVRNDSIPGQSFVFMISCLDIEKNEFVDTSNIRKAVVKLIENETGNEYPFSLGTTISDTMPYAKFISPCSFRPLANTKYLLDITFPNGERIVDSTIVPEKPFISSNDLTFQDETLLIKYKPPQHSAYSQIYISPDIVEDNPLQIAYRDTSEVVLKTGLKRGFSSNLPRQLRLDIYTFDENYLKYQKATVNIFLHQYNPTISTMSDAYGCFFAVSDTSIILNLSKE